MMPELQSRLGELLGTPAVAGGASLALKATIILALAALAARLLGRSPAARRHLVLNAGLLSVLLLPIVSVAVPGWRVALLPAVSWQGGDAAAAAPASASLSEAPSAPVAPREATPFGVARTPVAVIPSHGPPPGAPSGGTNFELPKLTSGVLLATLWLAGAVLSLVPWVVGLFVRRRFARHASAQLPAEWEETLRGVLADEALPSRVRVLATSATSMPMTWGVARPIVLVPRDVSWTRHERRAALLHEMAHVRRWDSLTQLAGRVACALYWFNPVVWLVARAERLAREEACDDEVLRRGARPSAYAEQLLGVASISARIPLPVAALTMARRSNLAERLRAVLDAGRDRSAAGKKTRGATLVAAALILAPLAALTPVRQVGGQSVSAATPAKSRGAGGATSASATPAGARGARDTTTTIAARATGGATGRQAASAGIMPATAPSFAAAPPDGLAARATSVTSAVGPNAAAPSPQAAAVAARGFEGEAAPVSRAETFAAAFDARRAGEWSTGLVDRVRAAAATVLPALSQTQDADCRRTGKKASHSISNYSNSSDDESPENRRWQVRWAEDDCRMELDARGTFTLTSDAADIATLSRGGRFDLLDATVEPERRVRIVAGPDGQLTREYWVDGTRTPYDASAAAWFAKALVALDRRTAFAVDSRLPILLQRGGVDAVLAETAQMYGDYPRRVYLSKLLARRSVTSDELARVLASASRSLESDYEKAELLVAVAKQRSFGGDIHLPFAKMAGTIESSYERRRALGALLTRDDLRPEVVGAVLAAADGMDSDYELAELLLSVSRRYAIDASTRPYYLKSLASLSSDYEHRRVLDALVKGGELTSGVASFLLDDARRLESDYELAEFLRRVATTARFDETVTKSYMAAVSTLESDYEHHRALSALVARRELPASAVRAVLQSARSLDSEYERASLLVELATGRELSEDLLETYLDVAGTLTSEHERDRALDAVPRARASRLKL